MSDAVPPYPNQIQDPTVLTQILAIDSSGRLTSSQGAAAALSGFWPVKVTDGTNVLPTADVAARASFHKITDGTNTMPTGDAAARALFVKQTDGTNTMPSADVAARAIFSKITDGTNTVTVNASGRLLADNSCSASGNGTMAALNALLTISTLGYSTLVLHVTGTLNGTITVYGTINGSQVFGIPAVKRDTNAVVYTITATGAYLINCSSLYSVQLYETAYVSGSVTVYWVASMGTSPVEIFQLGGLAVSQQIQTQDVAGTSKNVGFKTGSEQSVPSVIVDFTTPTNRAMVDGVGNKGLVSTDHRHSMIHSGLMFVGADYVTGIANGATRDYLFITPSTKEVHVKIIATTSTTGGWTMAIGEAPTTTANGSAITIRNKDRNSANAAGSAMYYTPTVTGIGTTLFTIFLNSTAGSSGLFPLPEDDLILAPNTKYLFRFGSLSGSNTLAFLLNFYEV